jgi:outer membrane protein assembly factor BamB
MVFAHHVRAGFFIWQYRMTGGVITDPSLVAKTIFVADTAGSYAMLSDQGELLWRSRTFGPITAQSVATIAGVYVASEDTNLYALDRREGKDKWRFSAEKPLTVGPTIIDSVLYQPLPSGELVALRARDGEELWRIRTDHRPLVLFQDQLLMTDGSNLYFRDPDSGELLDPLKTSRPIIHVREAPKGQLLLVSDDGTVSMLKPRH